LEATGLDAAGLEAAGLEAAGLDAAGLEGAGFGLAADLEVADLPVADFGVADFEVADFGMMRVRAGFLLDADVRSTVLANGSCEKQDSLLPEFSGRHTSKLRAGLPDHAILGE
jgi:uncharacterized protein YjbI with pentapeptide repeats